MTDLKIIAVLVLFLCLFVFAISAPLVSLHYLSCSGRAKDIGEYKYSVLSGCMVKPKGQEGFIPLESYKFIDGGIR